jgi:hypothetical protein
MTNEKQTWIFTNTERPKNCEIKVEEMYETYKISINKKQFDSLDEDDKINVYKYLNELEEKIINSGKLCLMVKEDFNE